MSYKVTLRKGEQTETVIVKAVEMLSDTIIFRTFDPSQCPDEMKDDIVFVSKRLSAMLFEDKETEVIKAEPTDKRVPTPEPQF